MYIVLLRAVLTVMINYTNYFVDFDEEIFVLPIFIGSMRFTGLTTFTGLYYVNDFFML